MIIWFFFFDLLMLIFYLRFLYKYSVNGTTSLYLGFIVLTLPALVLVSYDIYKSIRGLPTWLSGKESACQCRRHKRHGFHTWVGKIPWRRAWQPVPVFLPGESHGQRSLVGYSPWGRKELDRTEHPGGERIKEFIGFLLYVLRKFESISNSKFFPRPAPTWEPWVLSWLFCPVPRASPGKPFCALYGLFLQRGPLSQKQVRSGKLESSNCIICGPTDQPGEQLFPLSFLS